MLCKHSYIDFLCPGPSWGELDLMWTQVTYFFRVCTMYHLGREWSGDEGAREGFGCGASLLNGHYHSIRDQVWSQFARTKAQRVRLEVTLLPLRLIFPSPYTGTFPQRKEYWSECCPWTDRGLRYCLCRHPWLCSDMALGSISPCSSQLITIPCFCHSILLWNHQQGWQEPSWFLVYIEMLAVMGSWPSEIQASETQLGGSSNNGWHHPTWDQPQNQIISVS